MRRLLFEGVAGLLLLGALILAAMQAADEAITEAMEALNGE